MWKSRQGLRTKLFLPAILSFVTVAVAIHFIWVPSYLSAERDKFIQGQVKLVSTLEPEVARYVLEGDLAALHISLNRQLEINNPEWLSITVSNLEGVRLYPIALPDHIDGANVYPHKHSIVFGDEMIALLDVDFNWQPGLDENLERIHRIELLIMAVTAIVMLISMGWINIIVRRPLERLESAAARLSRGDYAAPLPRPSKDEIGNLTRSFAQMRGSLESSQAELSCALAESRHNAERYRLEVRFRQALYELQELSLTATGRKELLDRILEKLLALEFLHIERRGAILLAEGEPQRLVVRAATGLDAEEMERLSERPVPDALSTADQPSSTDSGGGSGNGEYALAISLGGKAFGLMVLFLSQGGEGDEIEREFLESVTDIAASGLNRLAYEDELRCNNLALEQARRDAESSSRAKSEFLATMSHELRTPLNGVLGMAQLLNLTGLNEEQSGYVETLISSGRSLVTLINDILDFSKIEAGKLTIENIPFDLRHEARQVVQLLQPRAEEKGLALKLHYLVGCGDQFIGDPVRVRQLLMNLVGNAIKFTHQGHVIVEVSCPQCVDGYSMLRVSVIDTGIGIAPEVQLQLFQSFTQADSSTTRKYGGTGLGLAICRRLVELMEGSIGVQSVPGEGSTFWFMLKLRKQEQAVGQESVVALPAEVRRGDGSKVLPRFKGRILVVEDNFVNQRLAATVLEKLGLDYRIANQGQEALALWEQGGFDLILMDCQMPVMDGFEATRLLRQREAYGHVPIIAMTANVMELDRHRCQEAGMDDHLSKPFQIDALISILELWLPEVEAGSGEEVIVDPQALDALRQELGSSFGEIVEVFISDTAAIMEKMEREWQMRQFGPLQRHAHTLKANATNFGANIFAAQAQRIEQQLAQGEQAMVAEGMARMRDLYPGVVAALRQALA